MATNAPQDDYMKTALRLPRELHGRLMEHAMHRGRSLNSEIVKRLEQTLDDPIEPLQHELEAEVKRRQLLEQKLLQSEFEKGHARADLDFERSVAERFRQAADLSDDFRLLTALTALRAIAGSSDGLGDYEIDNTMRKLLLKWLSHGDARGAVFSIVALLEDRPPEVVELLRNFAGFLEDMNLPGRPSIPELRRGGSENVRS